MSGAALTEADARDLRLLSIGHFACAIFNALFGLLQVVFFWTFFNRFSSLVGTTADDPEKLRRAAEALTFQREIMEWMLMLAVAFMAAQVLSLALVGHWLAARKHYNVCFGLSILNCLFFPLGTVAAVFAMIVLRRPSVASAFAARTEVP
jgi:hypothetical protein